MNIDRNQVWKFRKKLWRVIEVRDIEIDLVELLGDNSMTALSVWLTLDPEWKLIYEHDFQYPKREVEDTLHTQTYALRKGQGAYSAGTRITNLMDASAVEPTLHARVVATGAPILVEPENIVKLRSRQPLHNFTDGRERRKARRKARNA